MMTHRQRLAAAVPVTVLLLLGAAAVIAPGVAAQADPASTAQPAAAAAESISPELARAIAWTAALVAQERWRGPLPAGTTEAMWAALRRCESGGNYGAVSRSGRYRGAYQFDRRTWGAYGPAGDPAAAHPVEQDRRARALYRARGRSPWPVCGRKAGFPARR